MARTHPKLALAAVSMAALVGCKPDASFRARWELAPAPDAATAELTSPSQCSNVGVMAVQVTTRDELGFVVDSRLRPCFPPGFEDPDDAIDGPTLDPGIYAIEVRGVRRDEVGWTRTPIGEPTGDFPCEPIFGVPIDEQNPQCDPSFVACDCRALEVRGEETTTFDDFALKPPPQCEDGIDNDRDGLVDDFDPACAVAGFMTTEDAQVNEVRISLRPTLLDKNPNVLCSGPHVVARFEVEVDDTVVAEPVCSEYLGRTFTFSVPLAAGPHNLRVTALRSNGEALTVTKEFPLPISDIVGDAFDFDVDFAAHDFLEEIIEPAIVSLDLISQEGAPGRFCAPEETGGGLTISELRFEVLDAHGGTISPPIESADGVALDGTPSPCDPSAKVETRSLSWGGYLLAVEALSVEGEVCFSNVVGETTPAPLAPAAEASRITIPRTFPVPDSCRDCTTDDDCKDPYVCDADGVCVAVD